MSSLSEHHKVLTNGVGKCSKPMWDGMGMPAGFCDSPAYGRQNPIRPDIYCSGLACPRHGGPLLPNNEHPADFCARLGITLD